MAKGKKQFCMLGFVGCVRKKGKRGERGGKDNLIKKTGIKNGNPIIWALNDRHPRPFGLGKSSS